MEKTVAKTLENNKHMAKITFVPVTNCHRDACNSRLFHESKLFGIQSIGTNVGKVTGRCRICTVDKANLSNPQVASEAPRRTKANTNIIIAGMSEMGVVERKRQETETGTLFSQNNQLFSDDIVIEPHIQMWPIIARVVMCCPEAFTAASVEYIGRNTCRLVTKANILLSEYLSLIRSASLTNDEARQLQVEICDHHKLFERIWKADVANHANIHCGYHTREQTDVLGHPMIGDCNRFERYHHRVKDMVIAHKNGVSMEKTIVKRIAVLDFLSTLSAPNHVADNTSVHGLPGYAPVYRASGSVALVSAAELRQRRGLGLRQHGNEVLPELSKLQV
ncbi:hypothetical protein SKAU_G00342560 [Synaphobranchus kaupii]|uniref:Uncharacterized protein n=1 Tax=Synaphobranchus kaupii TaxID=118154 RepID=A0A9Q1ENH0_SYNKA|nr:hypothetical protein SKAU_G00342560 [Synaphobranchus kaupii]